MRLLSAPALSRRACLYGAAAWLLSPALPLAAQVHAGASSIVSLSADLSCDLLALGAPLRATATHLPGASRHPRTKLPTLWRAALGQQPQPPQPLAEDAAPADMAALKPDLIVVDARRHGPAAQAALQAIAPVLAVEADSGPWADRLKHLAQALGRQAQAQAALAQYQSALQAFAQNAPMPADATWDVLQMNGQDPAGDPLALSPDSPLGRVLAQAGFKLENTAAKVPGQPAPDALGRAPFALGQLKQVLTAPWALLLNHGEQIASQICCTPAWQEIPTITRYQRYELAEFYLRPNALSALHLLGTLQDLLSTRAAA